MYGPQGVRNKTFLTQGTWPRVGGYNISAAYRQISANKNALYRSSADGGDDISLKNNPIANVKASEPVLYTGKRWESGGEYAKALPHCTTTLNGFGDQAIVTKDEERRLGNDARLIAEWRHVKSIHLLRKQLKPVGIAIMDSTPDSANQLFTVQRQGLHNAINNSDEYIGLFNKVQVELPITDREADGKMVNKTPAELKNESAGITDPATGRRVPLLVPATTDRFVSHHLRVISSPALNTADIPLQQGVQTHPMFIARMHAAEITELLARPVVVREIENMLSSGASAADVANQFNRIVETSRATVWQAQSTAQEVLNKYVAARGSAPANDSDLVKYLLAASNKSTFAAVLSIAHELEMDDRQSIIGTAFSAAEPGNSFNLGLSVN